jgi:hypothetical protein
MAYGTAAGVAALTRRYTNAGSFDGTTNPTVTTVGTWLAQVSSMFNISLAAAGFTTPITDADVTPTLDSFTETMVADLVNAANASGRFYTDRALEYGVNPIKAINNDIKSWVESNLAGLAALGGGMATSSAGQIAYRDGDDSGKEISPLFSRDQFGAWEGGD